jgi:RNA polymerase sigma factor (sigma-70 family)
MAQALVAERYPRLLARARMLVPSLAEAEDLVQEALVATFSKPRGFASMPQAEQYVRRAIVTTHLNAAKRGARERQHWAGVGAVDEVPDHAGHVAGEADVAGILHGLAPRVRACVVLRYLEDLSIADTARALGLSEGAVKRYVSDGLRELNGRLGTHATVEDVVVARVDVRPGGVA